jgi:peroxiredoxin
MKELGELQAHHEEFAKRQARVVVVSNDDQKHATDTQKEYKDLIVVADPDRKLIAAAEVLHPGVGPGGEDVAAPTTFLIDKEGMVRSLFRPRKVITRLSAEEVLAAVDKDLPSPK